MDEMDEKYEIMKLYLYPQQYQYFLPFRRKGGILEMTVNVFTVTTANYVVKV